MHNSELTTHVKQRQCFVTHKYYYI